jgi:hypothetical protein
LSEFVEEGTADGGPVPTRRRRESRAAATPGTTATYKMTAHVNWTKISAESPGRRVEPIPYTGENEFFGVNMSDREIEKMKDERILGWTSGTKIRSDKKKPLAAEETAAAGYGKEAWSEYCVLARMQKKSPWRTHQSVGARNKARGFCCWEKCPGLKETNAKRTRSYSTMTICEECTAKMGSNVWLCSGKKGNDVLPCHIDYHRKNHNKEY